MIISTGPKQLQWWAEPFGLWPQVTLPWACRGKYWRHGGSTPHPHLLLQVSYLLIPPRKDSVHWEATTLGSYNPGKLGAHMHLGEGWCPFWGCDFLGPDMFRPMFEFCINSVGTSGVIFAHWASLWRSDVLEKCCRERVYEFGSSFGSES